MRTLLITMVLGLIISIYATYKNGWRNNFLDYLGSGIFGILFGIVTGIFIALLIPSETEMKLNETLELQSFKDGSSINGSFFLGTGSIDGTMKYTFYYKTEGGFKMKQLNYDNVIVKYSDEAPKVEEYKSRQTNASINKYSFDLKDKEYIVYVPEGTVKNNYVLDAQ